MKPNKLYKRSFILTLALAAVFALAAAWPCVAVPARRSASEPMIAMIRLDPCFGL